MNDTLLARIVSKVLLPVIIGVMRIFFSILVLLPSLAFAFTSGQDITALQKKTAAMPLGERIAFWAERFVGTPYDDDPMGEYVRREVIVSDERVDCMYLTFRSVELAMGRDSGDSLRISLDRRFIHTGKVNEGKVLNYEDRFKSGEEMLESGKWGEEVTSEIGDTSSITGPAGKQVFYLLPEEVLKRINRLQSGDIVYFIKPSGKISAGTIIGHLGTIKKEGGKVYLIHASGRKGAGGRVKKVLFRNYLSAMPFAGIKVGRFPQDAQK